jgi:hypothetical protein
VILGLWLVGLPGSAGPLPGIGFLGEVDLKSLPGGGYSALHLSADGAKATLLSDKGFVLEVGITRKDGRVSALRPGRTIELKDSSGRKLRPGQNDTEGLAMAPNGRAWVSTEGTARVMAYPALDGLPKRMPRPRAFADYPPNTAFEAIARAPDGRLWLIPEGPIRPGVLDLWTSMGKDWQRAGEIPADPFWLVADAAFDDRGRLYLLERLFAGPAGFASRLRRFETPGEGAGKVIWRTSLGTHDNLEALALWRQGGALTATMVSDDNFLKLFRAEWVEYRLPED